MAGVPPPPPVKSEPGSFAWMDWYRKLYDYLNTAGSVLWSSINFTGSSLADIVTRPHSALQSILGTGAYHVSATEGPVLTNILASGHAALSAILGTGSYHISAAEATKVTALFSTPVTKTADFTLAATETWIINNKASACVVTLPAASGHTGRSVTFQNYQDFTLTSVASDVVPQGGGAVGTAILPAVAGNWATLVSNGTNWVIMQAAAYNNLLLS